MRSLSLAERGEQALEQALNTGDRKRLDTAVGLLERARDALAPNHADRPEILSNLGVALRTRYEHTGRIEDLEEAIELARQAAATTPQDHPDRPGSLTNLGVALFRRFERTDRLEDLDESIDVARQAAAATPQDHPDRPGYLADLDVVLGGPLRAHRPNGRPGRVDRCRTPGGRRHPQDHPDRPDYLSALGVALLSRFFHTGQMEALDEAIDLARQAADSTPENNPDRPGHLANLGAALRLRIRIAGRIEDLDESIDVGRQTAATTPQDDPDRPGHLINLWIALRSRFLRTGRMEDLDEAIDLARQAAAVTPEDHPDRTGYLSDLETSLYRRFQRTDRIEDLDELIGVARQAAAVIAEGHPDRSEVLSILAVALLSRFNRTGRIEDLDETIELARQAAITTPQDQPDRPDQPGPLSILERALRSRFERTGRIEDLDEATELTRQAAATTPQDHPDRPAHLSALGLAQRSRFERTGRFDDLQEAIELARQAAESIPVDHPDRPAYLSNLAGALHRRFRSTDRIEDLEEAIEIARQAVESTPADNPNRPGSLSILERALYRRFLHTGRMEDLDESVELARQAAGFFPEDHPDRAGYLSNVGLSLYRRFERTGRIEDLDEALTLFRWGAASAAAPVDVRAYAAREWGRSAVLGLKWAEAVEGYGAAVNLAGLVASQELGRPDQEFRLGRLDGLGPEAAAACIQAGKPGRAVEMFEHGRAVLFSRVLDSRSDLTDLQQALPELADRFVRSRDTLDRPDPALSGFHTDEDTVRAEVRATAHRRREAAVEISRVLAEIRTRPGFERFLTPRSVAELLPAAADGPVVLLNVAPLRSDALILTKDGVDVLPLEGVDLDAVVDHVSVFLYALAAVQDPAAGRTAPEAVLAGVLAWLGDRVTGPVLDHLGYTAAPARGIPWPRVWWCPSGALSLLPFHAAGHHEVFDGPSEAVIDRVISSTIPTLGALLRARQMTQPTREPRMLVVAMPHTPGQADLPGVYREADSLLNLYAGAVDVLGLPGRDPATYDTVTAALPAYPWVHFSCHGESDLNDPSASHLLLADYQTRPLTVHDMAGARLQGAELAFLSACTTARTGTALPDEPIHLSAACQLAGYRHVVASLWPIDDADAAWLTESFYTTLMTTPGTRREVATALHVANRQLRLLNRARPSRWAPYTHTGP